MFEKCVIFRQVGEAEAEELSEDEFEDEGWQTDEQIYETVRIEQRKKESTSSQVTLVPQSKILTHSPLTIKDTIC